MLPASASATASRLFLALIAFTAVAGGGLNYWLFDSMGDTENHLRVRQTEVGDENSVRAKITEVQTGLETARSQMTFLEQSVSDAWYVPTLLKQLEQTAAQSGLTLLGVRPTPVKKEAPKAAEEGEKKEGEEAPKPKVERKPYQELDVQVSVKGSFWDVMRFLKALNTFPKILSVRQMTIQPETPNGVAGQDQQLKNMLSVTMTVRAFVFTQRGNNNANSADASSATQGGAANGG